MVVLGVPLEVIGQVSDPVGQKGHLDLGRARIRVVGSILPNYVRLLGPVIRDVHSVLQITLNTLLFYKRQRYHEGPRAVSRKPSGLGRATRKLRADGGKRKAEC